MNLSEPLDGLTSEVEAAVLRALARSDAGFSGRQVHGLAGVGSTSSVHRALGNLVHLGLVTSEARPPAIVYRVNRDHVLWPVVELGLASRARAFDRIRSFFAENVPSEAPEGAQITALLYGSVARRESNRDSDVDLFLVFPDAFDPDARADFSYRLAEHTRRITGNEAQVLSVERSDLAQRLAEKDPLVANVVADGVHLFGPPVETAASSAA